MDTTTPVLRFEEGFTSLPPQLQKESIVGGPVTCVAFRPSLEDNNTTTTSGTAAASHILVARGPFLEQYPLLLKPNDDNTSSPTWRCLAFPNGGIIHGIRQKSNLCVVFGGRQIAILYPETTANHHNHNNNKKERSSTASLATSPPTPLPVQIGLEPPPSASPTHPHNNQFNNSTTSFGTNPSLCLTDVFGSKRMAVRPSTPNNNNNNNKSSGIGSTDESIWLEELDTPQTSTAQLSSSATTMMGGSTSKATTTSNSHHDRNLGGAGGMAFDGEANFGFGSSGDGGGGGGGGNLDTSNSLWLSNSLSSPQQQHPRTSTATANPSSATHTTTNDSRIHNLNSAVTDEHDNNHHHHDNNTDSSNNGTGPTSTLTVSDLVWDVELFADTKKTAHNHAPQSHKELREYTMVVAMAQNSCEIWKIVGSESSPTTTTTSPKHQSSQQPHNILVRVERIQHVACQVRCITYCMSIFQRQRQPSYTKEDQESHQHNKEIVVVAGTVFNEVLVWTAWSSDTEGTPPMEEESSSKISMTHTRSPSDLKKLPSTLKLECSIFEEDGERNMEEDIEEDISLDSILGGEPGQPHPETQQSPQQRRPNVDHRLVGHEGVIHSVKVFQRQDGSTYIASTSDDRTVRLWEQQQASTGDGDTPKDKNDFHLKWTGYGHTARVWDVSFCSLPHNNSNSSWGSHAKGGGGGGDPLFLVSAGEDGTARVWNMDDGTPCSELRGNGGSVSLWKIDTWGSLMAAGSNDGTAKIWNLQSHLRTNDTYNNNYSHREEHGNSRSERGATGPFQYTCQVPDDSHKIIYQMENAVKALALTQHTNTEEPATVLPADVADSTSESPDNMTHPKKKKKKKKPKQKNVGQIIFGMKLFHHQGPHNNNNNWPEKLLVATRAGSLFSYDFDGKTWAEHESWFSIPAGIDTDTNTNLKASDGTCMCVNDSEDVIAIGTSKGDILVTHLQLGKDFDSSDNVPPNNGARSILLEAREFKTTQGIVWKNKTSLVSFHIKGVIIVWEFRIKPTSRLIDTKSEDISRRVFDMGTVGIPLCFATDLDGKRLITGDSRGNVAVFDMGSDAIENKIIPTQVITRAHGKEHVNAIACQKGGRVVSVGNDGCVREYFFKSDGALQKTLSVPTAFLSGLSYIWIVQNQDRYSSIIVGGYHGSFFVVLDVSHGYELLRVDTGGRQRQQDCFIDLRSSSLCEFPLAYHIAILRHSGGKNEITFHSYHSKQMAESTNLSFQYSIGVGIHSETIFDLCFCETSKGNHFLLSGSEDNGAKLSTYKNGTLKHTKHLHPHESCIRAVCCSRDSFSASSSSLLVTCGGKLSVKFYILDHHHQELQHAPVRFLGTGSFPSKASIDQRINAVEAIALTPTTNEHHGISHTTSHLVIAGDSNGCVYLFQISEETSSPNSSMMSHKLYEGQRPVLSINILRVRKRLLVLVGTTGGSMLMWDLPGSVFSWEEIVRSRNEPLFEYDAHQMGTNCISSMVLNSDKNNHDTTTILICSGGDDQAITVCKASVHFTKSQDNVSIASHGSSEASISSIESVRLFVAHEASISAIKGIHLVSSDRVLSVGYGQRLALWKIIGKKDELTLLSSAPVDVSDVNCLAFASSSCSGTSNNNIAINQGQDDDGIGEGIVAVGGEGIELFSF